MKTVKKGEDIVRKSDAEAHDLVKKYGWAYCKKSEWKSVVRDKGKKVSKPAPAKETVKEKKSDSKGYEKYKSRKAQKAQVTELKPDAPKP